MRITFLGAAGTVTGSKYLLDTGRHKILVDCGLFQGFKQLRLRNWAPLPVNVGNIDAVVLTHAHLDHTGYLPLLVRNGFRGRVYATRATRDLCGIMLPDSAHLEEQAAESANRHHYSKHRPALPLYTVEDAKKALTQFRAIDFHAPHDLGDGLTLTYRYAGHILGAATAQFTFGGETIVFSGDLGRPGAPILRDYTAVTESE